MEICMQHLARDFGRVHALRDINMQIKGGMFGLLGPNGAGKTTLMRILATILPMSSGTVQVGGWDVKRDPHEIRRRLGYIPQTFGFYRQLNAFEQLDYIATLKGLPRTNRREKISQVLEKLNLLDVSTRWIGTYSGGMKQRLGIAQAILGDPELIIVDEPTAGLDPEERVRFRNLFANLADSSTVILSTHIVADIEASCSALAVISQGSLAFWGTADELTRKADGRVWAWSVPAAAFSSIEQSLQIISSRQNGGQQELRVLTDARPADDARPCEPALEDGYLALLASLRQEVRRD